MFGMRKKCFFHQMSVIKTGPNKGTVCSSLSKCQRTVITNQGTSKHLKGRSVSNGFASQRIWLFSCFETLSVLVLCPLRVTVFASQRIFSFSCFYTFKSVWKQENDKIPLKLLFCCSSCFQTLFMLKEYFRFCWFQTLLEKVGRFEG